MYQYMKNIAMYLKNYSDENVVKMHQERVFVALGIVRNLKNPAHGGNFRKNFAPAARDFCSFSYPKFLHPPPPPSRSVAT